MVDFGPKAPKRSPLTSVTQSQRIWTQDTAIPTSLPCCARASFHWPCSRHSSTLQAYSAPVLRGSAVHRKVLSHISSGRLGTPIGGHLDPRHGESDIAPVLRQSIIALAMLETFVDFGVEHCRSGPSLKIDTFPKYFK